MGQGWGAAFEFDGGLVVAALVVSMGPRAAAVGIEIRGVEQEIGASEFVWVHALAVLEMEFPESKETPGARGAYGRGTGSGSTWFAPSLPSWLGATAPGVR